MARLRIRIELSRGGMGVPLRKMASVISETQNFLHLLGEDVGIDQTQGEWLGFDFDRESLFFTAEYVGQITAGQVQAFNAAFDGTTSLRRGTIAQFARITEAIGEDEIVGFGLYPSDDLAEPAEWRCLSRRDALRIAEGIQILLEASGESDRESHMPAVPDPGLGDRLFGDRRGRSLEQGRLVEYVREVESSLSSRMSRVEHQVEQHAGLIRGLHSQSVSTEESFQKFLATIENFCGQATRQIEQATPAAAPAPQDPLPVTPALPEPPPVIEPAPSRWWRPMLAALAIVAVAALAGVWLLAARTGAPASPPVAASQTPIQPAASPQLETAQLIQPATPPRAAASANPAPPPPRKTPATVAKPAPVQPAATPPAPPAVRTPGMKIEIAATESTWVSLVDAEGNSLLVQLLQPGTQRTVEVAKSAILRTGNAGGLAIRLDGKPIGPIGPAGKVYDIEFRDGAYRILPSR